MDEAVVAMMNRFNENGLEDIFPFDTKDIEDNELKAFFDSFNPSKEADLDKFYDIFNELDNAGLILN